MKVFGYNKYIMVIGSLWVRCSKYRCCPRAAVIDIVCNNKPLLILVELFQVKSSSRNVWINKPQIWSNVPFIEVHIQNSNRPQDGISLCYRGTSLMFSGSLSWFCACCLKLFHVYQTRSSFWWGEMGFNITFKIIALILSVTSGC